MLAQDYFTDEVGRVLAFGGSESLCRGTQTLRHLIEQLPHTNAALAAKANYRLHRLKPHKMISFEREYMAAGPTAPRGKISVLPPDRTAAEDVSSALGASAEERHRAIEVLGAKGVDVLLGMVSRFRQDEPTMESAGDSGGFSPLS